jgi:type I restriction enzyme S subunit
VILKTVPLAEVADVAMGSAPPGKSYNETEKGLPMIAGAGDYGEQYPQPKKWTTTPTRVTEVGDLIVCVRATIGDLNWADKEYCLGRGVAGLRAKEGKLDIKYAAHYINAKKTDLSKLGTGSTFLAIRRADLEEFPIPLPPLTEQKRIAAILDKADAIRRKRQQAIQLADDFLRAVFLDMFGDPVTNPKGWEMFKLGELLTLITYGLTVRPTYVKKGISLISAKELRSGYIDFNKAQCIAGGDFQNLTEKGKPRKGDILFSKTGSIGHCAIVETDQPFAITQNAARLVFNHQLVRTEFAINYLRLNYIQDLANREAKGNAVKDLQLGIMKEFPMYLPPIEIQQKFCKLQKKALKQAYNFTIIASEADMLFSSLTQRAFRGEL